MTVADPSALETFDSLDPATDEVLATWPVDDEVSVGEAVDRARLAALWWADQGFDGRRERLLAWKGVLTRRIRELAQLVHRENGKPVADATLEIVAAIDHVDWAARHARKELRARTVWPTLVSANQQAWLEYQPLGIVGVIGPWNYPVLTPMGSIAYALAAGNAVIFKPSEFTPGIGAFLVRMFGEVVPEQPVLQLVTGDGRTGSALAHAGVDKISFTGSERTGRLVMAACAESLTPILMECGGKDALIVDADADLDAAAEGAAWAGMSNAGQTCIGIERVYVVASVRDAFLDKLTKQLEGVRAGSDPEASYGPITMPRQVGVIRGHVKDAIARGGRPRVGDATAVGERFVAPIVLTDVPEDSVAVTEETFGPVLVVNTVRDADEAVERVNASGYGLGGAVYSRKHGMELARRMRSGMTSVNAVAAFAFVPSLPFGGVGSSGFGRIHGADGLREFTRPKAITRQRFPLPTPLTTFRRKPRDLDLVVKLVTAIHGRRTLR